jgi:hypothetical protein
MKKYSLFLIMLLGILIFAGCEDPEGALYSGEPNKVGFLGSSTNQVMGDGPIKVPIGRTSIEGDYSVSVDLSATGVGYTDVFNAGQAQFSNGSAKTYVEVTYTNLATIDPSTLSISAIGMDVNVGLAYPFKLTVSDDAVSQSGKKSINVLASNALEFESIGNSVLNSNAGWWGGETEDDYLSIEIHKAEGVNVYKLISPFGFNNFAFMIKADNSILMPDQIIYDFGSSGYGPVTMSSVTGKYDPENNTVTLNVGAYTVSAGSFGGGIEIIYLP